MVRSPLLPGGLLGLLLAGGLALAASYRPLDQGPVYTVAQVEAQLASHPRAWVGRALLVRGAVVPCLAVPSVGERPCAALAPGSVRPPREPLTLVQGDPPPVALAWLRRVPVLGTLLPAPQVLTWGVVATYRVRLQATPESICGSGVCFEALLLDAAPGAVGEG
jgi:hypothetical protein